MWDINGGLIQIEVGMNVSAKYTAADRRGILDRLWGVNGPEEGDLLIVETQKLRQELAEQNIILPPVAYRGNTDLQPDDFIIYVGIEQMAGNIRKNDLLGCLKDLILSKQISDASPDGVRKIFQDGVELFNNKHYSEAVPCFILSYYWGMILGCNDEVINTIINVGGINLVNNQVEGALMNARHACLLAENSRCYNPYLKYYAHNFLANMYWLQNERGAAVECYQKAVADVQFVEDLQLYVFALWNSANAFFWTGDFASCKNYLDEIYGLISDHDDYPKAVISELFSFRALVSDVQIEMLKEQNQNLQKQCNSLSMSLSNWMKQDISKVVKQYGPNLLCCFFGALCNLQINNHSFNNNNNNIY